MQSCITIAYNIKHNTKQKAHLVLEAELALCRSSYDQYKTIKMYNIDKSTVTIVKLTPILFKNALRDETILATVSKKLKAK